MPESASKTADELVGLFRLQIRDANRARASSDLFRQLTSEALAIIDEDDPDHEQMDIRQWIRAAKQSLEGTPHARTS